MLTANDFPARPMQPYFCVTDLDGTLVPTGTPLSHRQKHQIKKLYESGITLTVATHRTLAYLHQSCGDQTWQQAVVTHDGAALQNPLSGKMIACFPLTPHQIDSIRAILKNQRQLRGVFQGIDDHGEREQSAPLTASFCLRALVYGTRKELKRLMWRLLPMKNQGIRNSLIIGDDQQTFLQICHVNAHKGQALRAILRPLCPRPSLVAFGNGRNDRSMFELAEQAISVAGAHRVLRKMSHLEIGHAHENAVLDYLTNRFVSIKPK